MSDLVRAIGIIFFFAFATIDFSFGQPPKELEPLIRFLNNASNQHSYTHKSAEVDAWRAVPTVEEHKVIGLIATRQLPGTVRLHRAYRETNQKHFYYTVPEAFHRNVTEDRTNFSVFVWTDAGDGRIPIYGSSGPDGTDVFFDSDQNIVVSQNESARSTRGITRNFNNDTPLFYVYPVDPPIVRSSSSLGEMPISKPLPVESESSTSLPPAKYLVESLPTVGPTEDLTELIERCERSVVRIETNGESGNGLGSGFLVGPDLIATNFHVLAGVQAAKATFPDGNSCTIVGTMHLDEARDIALARVIGNLADVPILPIARELPRKGSSVVALGSPLGLSFTATSGVVSAVRKAEELQRELVKDRLQGTWIQLDAALSPGNSGGPVVDRTGNVIAMSTLASTGAQNLNFGISGVDVRSAMEQVQPDKIVTLSMGVGRKKAKQPNNDGMVIATKQIPTEAIEAYIDRGRSLFPSLKRDISKEVSRLRQNLSAMRNGETRLPENLRRRGSVPDVVRAADPNRKNAEIWYFRSDAIKQQVIQQVSDLIKEMQQLAQQLKGPTDPESLYTLLTKLGPPIDTRESGTIGFVSSATVIHAYNDHDVIASIDDAIYFLHLESTAGLSIGRETLPSAYYVSGTTKVTLPDGVSMSVTVLQALSKEELRQVLSDQIDAKASMTSQNINNVQTWTDITGKFSIEALLVAVDDDTAVLRKPDGQEIRVPVNKLSQESQSIVSAWRTKND